MKEFFCTDCRRYKKIELLGEKHGQTKRCTACDNKMKNPTKTDECIRRNKRNAATKLYKKGLSSTAINAITGRDR